MFRVVVQASLSRFVRVNFEHFPSCFVTTMDLTLFTKAGGVLRFYLGTATGHLCAVLSTIWISDRSRLICCNLSLINSGVVRSVVLAMKDPIRYPILKHVPKVSVTTKNNIDNRSGSRKCVASKSNPCVLTQPNNVSIPHRLR